MKKVVAIAVTTATMAFALNGGAALAGSGSGSDSGSSGGGSSSSSGAWPAWLPLPTSPGTVVSQTSSSAVVRSTDMPFDVQNKLDAMYVGQLGCTQRFAVNRPKDYICRNPATGRTQEVWFTFAALDPKPTDPSRSQTNAFLG